MRRALWWPTGLCTALLLSSCSEGLLRESAPLPPAQLGISATFSASAGGSEQAYSRTNRMHVRFTKDGSVRLEQTLPFDGSAAEVRIPVDVTLRSISETFLLDVELLRDSDAVFRASSTVTLTAGLASAVELTLEPVLAGVTCSGATVVLDAIGATQQLGAAALFVTGDTIRGAPIQWTSQNAAIVSISESGVARAVSEGEATVRCSSGAQADTRAVSVAAVVSSIEVTPQQATIERGATQPLSAVVRDRLGNVLGGRAVTWTSSAPNIASVNATGVVTGVLAGTARIDAAAGTATGSATITVRNRPPTVVTGGAQLGDRTAVISGTVNPHGVATEAWFEFGTSPALGSSTAVTAVGAGDAAAPVSATLTGLAPGGVYFYRAVARNEAGVSQGAVQQLSMPLAITIAPTTATAAPGGTVRFTATVIGAANTAVTWESSNPAVATIDGQGIATAVGLGTTTITAIAVADPTRRAEATLTVERSAAVTIVSLASATTGAAVNPAAVAGAVVISASIAAAPDHDVRALAIFLGDVELCRQDYPQALNTPAAGSTLQCTVDTAEASESGVPRFVNGARTLRAAAFTSTGAVATEGSFCPTPECTVTLANSNTVRMSMAGAGPSQEDATGQVWWRSFTAQVTPIVYTAGDHAARIVLSALHPSGSTSQSIGPFAAPAQHEVTFSPALLAGVEGPVSLQAQVTTAAGIVYTAPEPAAQTDLTLPIDNRPPQLTALTAPSHGTWVPAEFRFAASAVDRGVGRGAGGVTFDVVPATAPAGSPVAGGAGVPGVAGVQESPTNQSYALRVSVSDLLGNRATYYARQDFTWGTAPTNLSLFGVDRTVPILTEIAGPEDGSTNWSGEGRWSLAFVDPPGPTGGSSGLNPELIRARLVRYDAEHPAGVCVNPLTSERAILTSNIADPACFLALDPAAPFVSVPTWSNEDEDDGYFTMTAHAFDNAGNRSADVTRTTLYDGTWPTVESITVPSALVGGQLVTFSTRVSDNVDLGDVTGVLGFTGDTALWLVQGRRQLSSYGLPLITSALVPFTSSFIRSITQTQFDGGITDRVSLARWFEVHARDQARLQEDEDCSFFWECERTNEDISAAVSAGFGTPLRDWLDMVREDQNFRFPIDEPVVQGNGQSVLLRAHITGSSGTFVNPVQRVVFYMRRAGSAGHPAEPIGQGTLAVADVPGAGIRLHTYSVTLQAAGIRNGDYEVIALAVDANGDALLSAGVSVQVDDDEFIQFPIGISARPLTPPPAPSRSRR